ncbi:hypothetical protein TB1_023357 [Malus domestica]|uniref:frataxin, mitochondrial n=1 Tax=Malus domestica TaxID=3750 RepID=UPI00397683E0
MASKLLPLRRLSKRLLKPPSSPSSSSSTASRACLHILEASKSPHLSQNSHDGPCHWIASRSFCSSPLNLDGDTQIPTAIDYHSVLPEDEFHRLADSTVQDLQEKFEEYGDSVQVDDFDIDYGNEVLTLKLGDHGTYVLNKQTPNRQIWLSSPVSGPQRFDWDRSSQAWVYRRTKAHLLKILESELEELCGEPISLS